MPRLAYLVSHYPAVSHTFILREVLRLRAAGFAIDTASINEPDRAPDGLTAEERAEAERTYYVKRAGLGGALAAHLATLATRPGRWLAGLAYAVALGGWDVRRWLFGVFYFTEALLVGRWMRARGQRHLHVHMAMAASTVALIHVRVFPEHAFSMTVHGPDEFYDVNGYRLAEKVARAEFTCCIGRYARSQLMRVAAPEHWSKIDVAPLGVDPAHFAPRPFREAPSPFEVLCVGRLVPAKGQHVLVRALERLLRDGRDVRLRLVGDGPDRPALERAIARAGLPRERFVLEGAVNQDRIRELYRGADAFALASFAEGIPVVLMEAMAMEIPVVTTFITGHPELVRDGVDGLLVVPSDDEALAAALARLMDDRELRRTLGAAGRARVVDAWDLERSTLRLAGIFRRRLGETAELASTEPAGLRGDAA
jgi:glycosyltransferase involved in cell wall biosynthesis